MNDNIKTFVTIYTYTVIVCFKITKYGHKSNLANQSTVIIPQTREHDM